VDGNIAEHGWWLSLALVAVVWAVVAGLPGAPLKGRGSTILAIAGAVIVLGYWLLAQGPANNPASLTAAPILLVLGYCILVPAAIFLRKAK
jgi:hypothetical protein